MAFTAKIADLIAEDKTGLLAKHESWERVPLSEVASVLNGAPFDSSMFNTASGIPLARIRDVMAGRTSTYYTGAYEDAYLLGQGDLLVGMDGDFNTGYWGEQAALLNQRVCKLTPTSEFYDKALLGYVLPGYLAAINANTPSITVKHLSSRTIGDIELPLPPRAEQTRIVEKLEELLSDLDAGVAELKAAQRKLAQYRQSLLKAAMEGALTADWRAAHGQSQETGAELLQRILSERRARWEQKQLAKFVEQGKTPPKGWQTKYPKPVELKADELPALPKGWAWASLDQLTEKIVDGTHHTPTYISSGVPFISVKDIRDGEISFDDCKYISEDEHADLIKRCRPQLGDLLVTKSGTIGRTAIVRANLDFSLFVSVALLKPASAQVDMSWVDCAFSAWFQSINVTNEVKGTAVKNLHLEDFRELALPLPPSDEQAAILNVFSKHWSEALDLFQSVQQSLKQAAAQRKNLLRAAFAGQLVPQNLSDEPASELLARIRAERTSNDGDAPRRRRKSA